MFNLKPPKGVYIMNNQTFSVSIQFIIDALQSRYDNVKDLWGGEASHQLWEQALALVEECGIRDNVTSPSYFVDNYLINGEFVSKYDDMQYWLDTEYNELSDYDKEHYECEEEYLAQQWQEYCTDNALLYNDKYACLSF